jgi:hypothetical protein
MTIKPEIPQMSLIVPQDSGAARAYLGYRVDSGYRVRGQRLLCSSK